VRPVPAGCPRPAPTQGRPRHEHALLRRSRAGDEGPGRLRPQGHRPWSLVATLFEGGILICAENPSSTLRKVSEIYDRIAFAGVGKYNEFDQLRIAGVRAADLKGYTYSREDVDARSLANNYAQILGQVFTHEMKPMEVEILVAEVAPVAADDQLFHILYDGTVMDEDRYTVLGGEAEAIAARMDEAWAEGLDLRGALAAAVGALAGPDRALTAADLEVAVLDRTADRRAFRRIERDALPELLPAPAAVPADEPATEPVVDQPPEA
jgi:proteasome alpha subunit